MKNKEQFDWAIGVLVKAYLQGKLLHADCACCAVGNLIASKCDYTIVSRSEWADSLGNYINAESWYDTVYEFGNGEEGLTHIHAIGYTQMEVLEIESAFELRSIIPQPDDPDGYLGLLAVVDALIEIHQGNQEEREEAKQLFHNAKESKAVEI